jgi:pimeloyl-ACP methyl ester carboxylesterase
MVKAPHGYNKQQREVAYAWMLQWAGGDASDFREEDFAIEKEVDTWCTTSGNVYREPRSRSPHDLVLEHLETHRPRQDKTASGLRACVKKVLCLKDSVPVPQAEVGTSRLAAGLRLTPVTIGPENGIALPAVWIESPEKRAGGPVIIYLNDKGKSALVAEKIIVQALLERGFRIFAVDLRGTGETSPGMEGTFWDFLAGRPIFGQRVGDIRTIVQFLSRSDADGKGIYLWAKGISAIYSSLAATLADSVTAMVLEEPLLTFEQVVTAKVPAYRHEIILPGVLEQFDLPQIYQALCPMKVTLINPVAGDKSQVSQEQAEHAYRRIVQTYSRLGKAGNWSVHANVDDRTRANSVLSALGE